MPVVINGSTGISGVDGSAGTPAFQGSDTNTGIRFGTDIVSLVTGGSDRLYIDSSGRLGVGTTSPGNTLHVVGTARFINGSNPLIISTDGGDPFVYTESAAGLKFGANSAVRMALDSSGRLGVGVSSPIAQTHIRLSSVTGYSSPSNDGLVIERGGGNDLGISIATENTRNGYLIFADGDSANPAWVGYDHSVNAMSFRVNASERARIDSSGRLLIGTSSTRTIAWWDTPHFLFEGTDYQKSSLCLYNNQNEIYGAVLSLGHSRGTSVGSNTILQNNDYTGAIAFYGSDGSNEIRAAEVAAYVDGTPGSNDMPGRLVFSTTADGASSPTERMRITQAGNTFVNYSSSSAIENEVFGVQGTTTLMGRFTNNTNTSGYHGIRTSIGSNGNNTSTYHFSGNTQGVNNWYLWGNGTTTYSSDQRLKKNIESTRDGYLDDIRALRVVKYNWKNHEDGTPKELGLIAQEVEQIFPGLVQDDLSPVSDEDPTIYKQLKGSVLPVILLKALQEAAEKIETLEARLSVLESA